MLGGPGPRRGAQVRWGAQVPASASSGTTEGVGSLGARSHPPCGRGTGLLLPGLWERPPRAAAAGAAAAGAAAGAAVAGTQQYSAAGASLRAFGAVLAARAPSKRRR